METSAYLVPSKEHDSDKSALHEESQDAFYGKWGTKDVAHKPGVVAPIGAKLKLKDDSCGNAHGEVDAKEFLPKSCHIFPKRLVCAIVASFGNAHDDCQSQGERDEQPVIDGGECELRSRPINGGGCNV